MRKVKKPDQLRLLLRQIELPAPPRRFTEEVMKETSPLSEPTGFDAHLRAILQDVSLARPTTDFTYRVQQGIRQISQGKQPKPLISRAAWISIAVFVTVCVVTALIHPSSDSPTTVPIYSAWFTDRLLTVTRRFQETILYLEVITISAALLLGIERILRRKLHGNIT